MFREKHAPDEIQGEIRGVSGFPVKARISAGRQKTDQSMGVPLAAPRGEARRAQRAHVDRDRQTPLCIPLPIAYNHAIAEAFRSAV